MKIKIPKNRTARVYQTPHRIAVAGVPAHSKPVTILANDCTNWPRTVFLTLAQHRDEARALGQRFRIETFNLRGRKVRANYSTLTP